MLADTTRQGSHNTDQVAFAKLPRLQNSTDAVACGLAADLAGVTAAILVLFSAFGLAISWRKNLTIIVWVTTLAGMGTAAALLVVLGAAVEGLPGPAVPGALVQAVTNHDEGQRGQHEEAGEGGGDAGVWIAVGTVGGILAVAGVVARNSIMLLSHYLHLMQHEGESFSKKMVIRGTKERLVPVLMTALAAGCAKVFMADPVASKLAVAETLAPPGQIVGVTVDTSNPTSMRDQIRSGGVLSSNASRRLRKKSSMF